MEEGTFVGLVVGLILFVWCGSAMRACGYTEGRAHMRADQRGSAKMPRKVKDSDLMSGIAICIIVLVYLWVSRG